MNETNENEPETVAASEVAEVVEKSPTDRARSNAAIVACFDRALNTLVRAHPREDHEALARQLLEDAHERRKRMPRLEPAPPQPHDPVSRLARPK